MSGCVSVHQIQWQKHISIWWESKQDDILDLEHAIIAWMSQRVCVCELLLCILCAHIKFIAQELRYLRPFPDVLAQDSIASLLLGCSTCTSFWSVLSFTYVCAVGVCVCMALNAWCGGIFICIRHTVDDLYFAKRSLALAAQFLPQSVSISGYTYTVHSCSVMKCHQIDFGYFSYSIRTGEIYDAITSVVNLSLSRLHARSRAHIYTMEAKRSERTTTNNSKVKRRAKKKNDKV